MVNQVRSRLAGVLDGRLCFHKSLFQLSKPFIQYVEFCLEFRGIGAKRLLSEAISQARCFVDVSRVQCFAQLLQLGAGIVSRSVAGNMGIDHKVHFPCGTGTEVI